MSLTSAAIKAIRAGSKNFKPSQIKNPVQESIGWAWWTASEGAANAIEALQGRTYVKAATKALDAAGVSEYDLEQAVVRGTGRAFDKTPYDGSSELSPYYEMSTQDLESEIEQMRNDPSYLRDDDLIAELDRILNMRLRKKFEQQDPAQGLFRAGKNIAGFEAPLPNTNYQQPEAPLPPPPELLDWNNK